MTSDAQELLTSIMDPRIRDNPLAFTLMCFPWGVKGTPLEDWEGPKRWQREELEAMAAHIAENFERIRKGDAPLVYRSATASGRGIGKSALSSFVMWWMLSTQIGSTTVVSANSETQLKTVTMAELGKWKTLALNSNWFEQSTMGIKPTEWFASTMRDQMMIDPTYYYIQAKLWNEENTSGFAGVHNPRGMLLLFDEASGIPPGIWSVSTGFFSDICPYRFWLSFSNPRANKGTFFDLFHVQEAMNQWRTRNIDSREVEGVDVEEMNNIIKRYGEDSDESRVEVKGMFPRTGDSQFIGREMVMDARERDAELLMDAGAALIMGVDPARFGSDKSVICFRQGRVNVPGRVPAPIILSKLDNMALADKVAHAIDKFKPDAVCIDAGNGTGVIDRLRQRGYRVHEVWFGGRADEFDLYGNKRMELWARMKEWIAGAAIDPSLQLLGELTGPDYKFLGKSDKMILESKEDMKKRGLPSPDYADALACTFAVKVAHRDNVGRRGPQSRVAADVDYKIFGG